MTEARLRARSVSEIVDAAFQLYREDAIQYIAVTAVAYAPWLVIELLFLPGGGAVGMGAELPGTLALVMLATGLGLWVAFALMSAVIIQLGSSAYLGQPGPRDIGTTIRQVLPRVPAIMVGGLYKYVLTLIGLMFFLVGALYVAARYFAVAPAIVLEGQGAWASLGRSSALSKGRKRHILNTLILVWLIYFILSFGVTLFTQIIGSQVVRLVASMAFTVVAYPIIGLAEMVLYYDARIRAEGFDIEMMAQGLEPGVSEA